MLIWLFEEGNVQHVLGTCESLLPLSILMPQCDQADLSQELSDSLICLYAEVKAIGNDINYFGFEQTRSPDFPWE